MQGKLAKLKEAQRALPVRGKSLTHLIKIEIEGYKPSFKPDLGGLQAINERVCNE